MGRILEVTSLASLKWIARPTSPVEQSPCNRGTCTMPSPEKFHAYTTVIETAVGTARHVQDLPAFHDIARRNHLRGTRVIDVNLIGPEITYCEFKRLQVYKYATLKPPPIGSSTAPLIWEELRDGNSS